MTEEFKDINPIDWNRIEDQKDLDVWNKLTSQFWLPEKVALSNDLNSWGNMTDEEKTAAMRVFAGLTNLDTIQGVVGAVNILPFALTPHEESVMLNIGFMEAYSGETELLTPHGWKRIDKIDEDDRVMQYDPSNNGMSFVKPKILPKHYNDDIYEIVSNTGAARQVVSGNHRVYIEEKVKKNHKNKEWTYSVKSASDVSNMFWGGYRRLRVTGKANFNNGKRITAEDRLKIAIQADGSFGGKEKTKRYTGEKRGTIPVYFSFSKERKISRLMSLSKEAGWELREKKTIKGKGNTKDKRDFVLNVPLEHAADRSKEFSKWWSLDELSYEWAKEFINETIHWDGTPTAGDGLLYATTNKNDSDFFVAVACLAGYRTSTQKRVDERSDNFNDSYCTSLCFNKDVINGQSIKTNKLPGREVYCVQVPSTFLLTRNGKTPVISGNCVHAKSYSYIFMTLSNTDDIDDVMRWTRENENMKRKREIILRNYDSGSPTRIRAASTLLESFLFYSGFYLPLYFAAKSKLTNTADIIRLIVRDEAVHGYYIGYKYQRELEKLTPEEQEVERDWVYDTLLELYDNEEEYAETIYDDIGLTEDVKEFMKYNANKALANLGYEELFPSPFPSPEVMTGLDISSENHDFFSGSGSSYVIGKTESTEDDDWDF